MLDQKALGKIILSLSSLVAFNIFKKKTTKDLKLTLFVNVLEAIHIKFSVSDKEVVLYEDG